MSRVTLTAGPAGPLDRMASATMMVATTGPGFTEITREIAEWLAGTGVATGLCVVSCRHTSASLAIQENADPDVQADLMTALDRLAPQRAGYLHSLEGPDDMPAHIRTMLTGTALTVPVAAGKLVLGTWQGLYLIEHRDRPHRRDLDLVAFGRAG